MTENGRKINIVTTGFHVNEVREAVAGLPVQIDVLITNLNPQLVVKLADLGVCLGVLAPDRAQREGDVLLLCDVSCLVEAELPSEEQAPTRAAALRGRSPL